ncbi:hypothetical protein V502_02940 [Pseudogymnoascus sp. VKM F-4520 (FW-2644)]|nr:hypothetical protein V502_02940 [Pseudogymnoascus sp. VKM F-4520 (FW-2644)]
MQKPRYQSGQYILKRIWKVATQLRKQGTSITLQWTPAYEGVIGNEKAHKWAQMATEKGAQPAGNMFRQLKSRTLQAGRQLVQGQTMDKFDSMRFGRFTRNLDKALPGTHMRAIYDQLKAPEARILVQLRTNHSLLNELWSSHSVPEMRAALPPAKSARQGKSSLMIPRLFLFELRGEVFITSLR